MFDCRIVLDAARVTASLGRLPTEHPCATPWRLQGAAEAAVRDALAPPDRTAIEHLRAGMLPWLVVGTGMDLRALPETPTGFEPVPDPAWWPLAWLTVGLMSLAGARIVSYACENDGAAFVNLVALPPSEVGAQFAEKSTREMRGHTDGAAFPFPSEFARGGEDHSPAPDLLVLVGLRNPGGTPTRLAPVTKALEHLTDEEVAALEGPHFNIGAQRTFRGVRPRVGSPLLSRDEPDGLAFRFSHRSVRAAEDAPEAAASALARLEEALPGLYEDVVIGPGDVCLVRNRLVVHGRGAPGEGCGGATRWLLRTYGWVAATIGHRDPAAAAHVHL
ncbi:TauD/TfdA family dioxygenase [Roseicella aerolata]|uniref:TauD/TfdA family dioxygenase n=1 Tax=Roseicella aerolata TaxID=2883479 RepID=A0A9X1IH78_9PROT|nr:TauD/TfdA family dioxygenase [Roseicella aerolata]MCB4824505.1 TauD/TfdA family dioxygenase [Roseicella aerolata]